jgi:uncharacterized protein DUF6912
VTRVYIPLNRAALESAIERGAVGPAPLTAYAVTPELQASIGMDLDDEELEYAAYRLAVDASRDMLAPDRSDDRRRLVVAADVTAIRPGAGGDPGTITVPEPIEMAHVAAIHADTTDAAGDDEDLAWYATQEAPDLLR